MKNLLTPKNDLVFKLLFTAETDVLADLISAVIGLSGNRRIRSVKVKNPIRLPEKEIKQKFIILDILATDRKGRHYDIEMQAGKYGFYPKRTVFYACRIYTGQLASGKDYGKLRPVMGIHFPDYVEYPEYDDFHFCFELRDFRHPELRLTDDMALHMLELPKFEKKMGKSKKFRNRLSQWLHFFNHAHEEGDETMRTHYENPAIHKAFGVLETLSADEETRHLAQIREESLMNEQYELDAARRKGKEEGERSILARQIAKKFNSQQELSNLEELSADELLELGEELLDLESLEAVHKWIRRRTS